MADKETLSVYDAKVADYVDITARSGIDPDLVRFMKHLPDNAFVLDLGCGPAAASVVMRDHGFRVDPVDASAGMVEFANRTLNIGARVATFDDINGADIYDGIWANFCLLHAPRSSMQGYLTALRKSLKPDGLFHIGLKLGEGEARDKLGRFYTYYTEGELEGLLANAEFGILDRSFGNDPGLSGETAPWITVLAKAA